MRATFLLACLCTPLLTFTSRAADEPTPEKQKLALKGKWTATEQFESGKVSPKGDWIQLAWEFKGDNATITFAGLNGGANTSITYDLKLDPTKQPAHIDLFAKNPKFGFVGIYAIDGDKLTVCWNAGRDDRPAKFETSKKDFSTMIVFKREK